MEIEPNQDFRDLFAVFNEFEVVFLIVGAHALAAHGHVRATKDIDVWVQAVPANAERLVHALKKYGAPTSSLSVEDFSVEGIVFQIGVAPVRVDVLTKVSGLTFDEAWPNRVVSKYGDQPVFVLSRADLIKNKMASGRHQDLADIERLNSD